ncbi:extracytoplasmic function alternative sigma factor [alpha proteobacterium U9-1i]|nr:extracytoplasmic function alternative sigma factor [alpha proteobacterium U9-1i]
MKTDQLIDMLARGVEPADRKQWVWRLAATLLGGLLIAALIVVIALGVRDDMAAARMPVMWKSVFSAFAAAMVLPLALRLARPGRPLGWRIAVVAIFVAAAILATVIALMGEAPQDRMDAWMGGGFPWCLVLVPVLAAPTAALLLWLIRGLAPTRLALTGAAIGAVSGGIGAMAYSMYCPVDSIAFVTTWYVAAIALCAALGGLIGSKFLRW